jgi:hypothetical protein
VTATVPTIEEFEALAARVEALEAQILTQTAASSTPWLTIPAAAHHLGLTVAATRKFLDRHHIDKHQHVPGGRVLVQRHDLDAAIANGTSESG